MFISGLNTGGKITERIMEELAKRLDVMPGLSSILDVYSMNMYRKRFIELFIEEPRKAYKVIEKVFAGNRDSINFMLKYLLRTFTRDDELISKIINELARGNDDLLKRIIYG